jgi:hypothetical protein
VNDTKNILYILYKKIKPKPQLTGWGLGDNKKRPEGPG